MNLMSSLIENVKNIDPFSKNVLSFGLRLSFGLLVLSAFLFLLTGKVGDYITALSCAKGALEAAPAVAVATVISALISDIAIKDRVSKN